MNESIKQLGNFAYQPTRDLSSSPSKTHNSEITGNLERLGRQNLDKVNTQLSDLIRIRDKKATSTVENVNQDEAAPVVLWNSLILPSKQ